MDRYQPVRQAVDFRRGIAEGMCHALDHVGRLIEGDEVFHAITEPLADQPGVFVEPLRTVRVQPAAAQEERLR